MAATKKAQSVEGYIGSLPAERREAIAATRKFVLKHLPRGYRECLSGNMISYVIPVEDYPATYNKQPLGYLALTAQKHYNALYLMGCYTDDSQKRRLEAAYEKAGRKLDMGKSCLRFGGFDELPHKVLGELIAEITPADYIAIYEKSRGKGG